MAAAKGPENRVGLPCVVRRKGIYTAGVKFDHDQEAQVQEDFGTILQNDHSRQESAAVTQTVQSIRGKLHNALATLK